jgi:hypothetical protein
MPKEYINPKELFPSQQYGFSQIITSSSGKMVWVCNPYLRLGHQGQSIIISA